MGIMDYLILCFRRFVLNLSVILNWLNLLCMQVAFKPMCYMDIQLYIHIRGICIAI